MGYEVLGQSAPAATTATDIYTVPASTETVCAFMSVCDRGAGASTYRVAVRPAGATLSNEHYVAYDVALGASERAEIAKGLSLSAGDVVTVYGSTADLSFGLFGLERSV